MPTQLPSLHYLTVQDILWINLQVTKRVNHFGYARLEEATFYQYAYGESNSLLPQAARFLTGFLRMHPFDVGNEATAFVSCAAFLQMNGLTLSLSDGDAATWFSDVQAKKLAGSGLLTDVTAPDPDYHPTVKPEVRPAVLAVLRSFEGTAAALAAGPASAVAS